MLCSLQDGKTALHIAAMHDLVEIAQLLLSNNFEIDQDDEVHICMHCLLSCGTTTHRMVILPYTLPIRKEVIRCGDYCLIKGQTRT